MTNQYGKRRVVQILTFFCSLTMLLVEGSSETGIVRHLFHQVFPSPLFWKYISYEDHLLTENVQNLINLSKMPTQIVKMFFVCEIIAPELAVLFSLY